MDNIDVLFFMKEFSLAEHSLFRPREVSKVLLDLSLKRKDPYLRSRNKKVIEQCEKAAEIYGENRLIHLREAMPGIFVPQLVLGWNDDFYFHCTKCGDCCYRHLVPVYPEDLQRMADAKGVSKSYAFKHYLIVHERVGYLKVRPDKRCIFNTKTNEGYLCNIHDVKPDLCTSYPMGKVYLNVAMLSLCEGVFSGRKIKVKDWIAGHNMFKKMREIKQYEDSLNSWIRKLAKHGVPCISRDKVPIYVVSRLYGCR